MDEVNAAYRRGQEDMRRRVSKRWAHWYIGEFAAAAASACVNPHEMRKSRVDVNVRAMRLRDLPSPSPAGDTKE